MQCLFNKQKKKDSLSQKKATDIRAKKEIALAEDGVKCLPFL